MVLKLGGTGTPVSAAKAAVGDKGVISWTRMPVASFVVQVSCTVALVSDVTVTLRTKGHAVGAGVGCKVGDAEGDAVVGEAEGDKEGMVVGRDVGRLLGVVVGEELGCDDGVVVGLAVVGRCVGENVSVGTWVGFREGTWVGRALGAKVMGTHAAADVLDGGKMVVKPYAQAWQGNAKPAPP